MTMMAGRIFYLVNFGPCDFFKPTKTLQSALSKNNPLDFMGHICRSRIVPRLVCQHLYGKLGLPNSRYELDWNHAEPTPCSRRLQAVRPRRKRYGSARARRSQTVV